MTPRITFAVAARVLTQLRRDPRTIALMLVVPCLLITLLWWMFKDTLGDTFDHIGPALIALFPFTVMFLVTSVTTLRERSSGTLERLLAMQNKAPVTRPILEINMRHPLVAAVTGDKEAARDLSFLLLEQAQILDGELPEDPAAFANRLNQLVLRGLKL